MSLKYVTGPITKADAGGLSAIITTPRVDSDGESVDPMGIKNRDAYLANPLVYWAHEWAFDPSAEPIGKALTLDVHADRIESTALFAPTAKAQNVRALVVGGFVRKTSIGFDPLQMADIKGIPTHIAWALREYSVVPMPANFDASVTGVKSALLWLAEGMTDLESTPVGVSGSLSEQAIIDLVQRTVDERLTLTADASVYPVRNGGPVSIVNLRDGRRVIASIVRRRVIGAIR